MEAEEERREMEKLLREGMSHGVGEEKLCKGRTQKRERLVQTLVKAKLVEDVAARLAARAARKHRTAVDAN